MSENNNLNDKTMPQNSINVYVQNPVNQGTPHIVLGVLLIIFSACYMLPTGIRLIKGKPAAAAAVINFFFGWTIIVWIVQFFTALD